MKQVFKNKKIFLYLLLIFCLVGTVRAQFFENLQKYIDKVGGIKNTTTTRITSSGFCFKNYLKLGTKSKDVTELQKVLALDKDVYPEGTVSGYFGKLTEKAVKQFQTKYYSEIMEPAKIIYVTGIVGQLTMKKLNTLTGCTGGTASNMTSNTTFITGTSKNTTTSMIAVPKDISSCVNNGDRNPVCALNKTGQLVTFPNKCFVEKLGYIKACDTPCPCNGKIAVVPSTIRTTTTSSWSWANTTTITKTTTTTTLQKQTTTTQKVYPYIEKYGNELWENLSEDRQFYTRMNIQTPNSLKSQLTLKNKYFDLRSVKGCETQGGIKMCYDGSMPKPSGYVMITSPEQLGQYFTFSSNTFNTEFFKNNVIYYAYRYIYVDDNSNCLFRFSTCSFDRVVYNVPDLDEIYRTGDTTEYNYRDPKYDMIRPKFTCRIEGKGCSFDCKEENRYMYDVIKIAKTSDKVLIDFEAEERICKE